MQNTNNNLVENGALPNVMLNSMPNVQQDNKKPRLFNHEGTILSKTRKKIEKFSKKEKILNCTDIETKEGYNYTCKFEKKHKQTFNPMDCIENSFNNLTVMRGANIAWDKQRLVDGKLNSLRKIGGKSILLKTESGNEISSIYFSVANFIEKIFNLGGKFVNLKLIFNHPFFDNATPCCLKYILNDNEIVIPSVARIKNPASVKNGFKNFADFSDLCLEFNLVLVWEDKMDIVNDDSKFNRQSNILIIPGDEYDDFSKVSNEATEIKTNLSNQFSGNLLIFSETHLTQQAIVFDKSLGKDELEKVDSLFNNLKINDSPIGLLTFNENRYFLSITFLSKVMYAAEKNKFINNPIFRLASINQNKPDTNDAGVIVLSMNQTNSFTQYTDEILTFLFQGMNVMVYDNANKGLSKGSNSQKGLIEAVEICGNFLIDKGFLESKIMFKGQCAGGLSSSKASEIFPRSNIWIDQSPKNFKGAVKTFCQNTIYNKENNKKTSNKILDFSLDIASKSIGSVAALVSSPILPSFDVIGSLRINRGLQIFSIGVPDSEGHGGDTLVPLKHKEKIERLVLNKKNGHYLPMPGAVHVTSWWLDSTTHHSIQKILTDSGLCKNLFLEKLKVPLDQLIDEKVLELSSLDPVNFPITKIELYELFQSVVKGDFVSTKEYINDFQLYYLSDKMELILNSCLELAVMAKKKEMAIYLLDREFKFDHQNSNLSSSITKKFISTVNEKSAYFFGAKFSNKKIKNASLIDNSANNHLADRSHIVVITMLSMMLLLAVLPHIMRAK